ncbi:MAG: nickel-dependent lactate racemase [Planctomycetota bacterium]
MSAIPAPSRPRQTQLLYGKGTITLDLPDNAVLLETPAVPALPDARQSTLDALRNPIGSVSLREMARAKKPENVVITISDITRPVPNEVLVTAILEELGEAGVSDDQCTVLIATGMHRSSTMEERKIMLGDALLERIRVVDHEADDLSSVVKVSENPPVGVNRLYVEADLKIVTGLIEPHFMAGFSGGRKGICPGLVDLDAVQRFHGYGVMADPNSVEGRLEGNPCHEEAMRVAQLVGCDFLVNCAITHDRRPAGIYAGEMVEAHLAGCAQVAEWNSAAIEEPADLVVTNAGGFPLDTSFYQTVKGMVTALPAIADGGELVIATAMHEVGSGEYTELMHRYEGDWRRFLADIEAAEGTSKDQWEFQMQTRVLDRVGVEGLHVVGDGMPKENQARLCISPVSGPGKVQARLQRFVDDYVDLNPGSRIAVIPQGPYTMIRAATLRSVC